MGRAEQRSLEKQPQCWGRGGKAEMVQELSKCHQSQQRSTGEVNIPPVLWFSTLSRPKSSFYDKYFVTPFHQPEIKIIVIVTYRYIYKF